MDIHYLPDAFLPQSVDDRFNLFVYQGGNQIDQRRVSLTRNVFIFSTHGQKEMRLSNTTMSIANQQALLIGAGNCLLSERTANDTVYQSTLFFFTNKNVNDFLANYAAPLSLTKSAVESEVVPYFLIEQDEFIHSFVHALSALRTLNREFSQPMLELKLAEILLYLTARHGGSFLRFLQVLSGGKRDFSFRKVIEFNLLSHLSLDDMAFLCNMSLSTFTRHFTSIYHETPGKWFQHKRLLEAKRLLQTGNVKVTDIYTAFGYENLSNFSAAFKNEFGISPRKIIPG